MKIYCELCKKVQPVQIDKGIDLRTKKPYEYIVCAKCNFIIASGTGIAPPKRKWVGLTDDEIIDVIHLLFMADMPSEATDYEIAKAIEAKLKDKNT